MPIDTKFDQRPIRPGSAPTLNTLTSGISPLCATQPMWHVITQVLVGWLQFHFSLQSRIEYPALADRVWVDDASTPIVISSLATWNPDNSQERPCILVDRLDQDFRLDQRNINEEFQGIQRGRHDRFMNGQHVVHCLGGREGEADLLAAEVWRELVRFAPIVRAKLQLLRFVPVKIGKRIELGEAKQHYSVPVIAIYGYEESWRVEVLDEAEILAVNTIFSPPSPPIT